MRPKRDSCGIKNALARGPRSLRPHGRLLILLVAVIGCVAVASFAGPSWMLRWVAPHVDHQVHAGPSKIEALETLGCQSAQGRSGEERLVCRGREFNNARLAAASASLSDQSKPLALALIGTSVSDLRSLAKIPSLCALEVQDSPLDYPGELWKLTRLRRLSLKLSGTRDLRPVAALHRLLELTLMGMESVDLRLLSRLTLVEKLAVQNPAKNDLQPLVQLPSLRSLDLTFPAFPAQITIIPLTDHQNPKPVEYSTPAPPKIEPLHLEPLMGLPSLRSLTLVSPPLESLAPLADLASLESLSLDLRQTLPTWEPRRKPLDLSPLAGMPALQALTVPPGTVDISPLAGHPSLQRLDLNYTRVNDLTPLQDLPRLETLHLNSTVTDLGPLSQLSSLKTLDLGETRVCSVEPLRNLESLRAFAISGFRLQDLSPLEGLENLKSIKLKWTAVTPETEERLKLAIPGLEISRIRPNGHLGSPLLIYAEMAACR